MYFKRIFLVLIAPFLFLSCSLQTLQITQQDPQRLTYATLSKTSLSVEELCIDENGDVTSYDPDDEWPYNFFTAVETSDTSATYEIAAWNMRFVVPVEYADFNLFWREEDGLGTLVIDDVPSEECLPVGDGGMASIYFSPVRTYNADDVGVYTNVSDVLDDGWHEPSDYLAVRTFDMPFFTVHEFREQSFGHSELVTNYFLHDGILYSLSTLDCETYCEAASLMEEILSSIHPIEDLSTQSAFSRAVSEMAQSYLRPLGPRADWKSELDEENYYATVSSPHMDGSATLTFFLNVNDAPVLAVSVLGCGPICHQDLVFLKYSDDGWHDVTDTIFPGVSQEELDALALQSEDFAGLFLLPQEGTTITFVNQYDYTVPPLYTFAWQDGVFVKEKVE